MATDGLIGMNSIVDIRLDEMDPKNEEGLEIVQEIQLRSLRAPVLIVSGYEEQLDSAKQRYGNQDFIRVQEKADLGGMTRALKALAEAFVDPGKE
jgi:hypothetical protein